MRFNFIILCIFLTIRSASQDLKTLTVPIKERVENLKQNLKKEIEKMGLKIRSEKSALKGFDYHTHNGMIEPVVEDSIELKTTESSATKSSTTKTTTTTLPLTTTVQSVIREHELTSKYAKDAAKMTSTIETMSLPYKRIIEPIVEEDVLNRFYAKDPLQAITATEATYNKEKLLRSALTTTEDHLSENKIHNETLWQNQLIYRRSFIDEIRNKPLNWVHCQHLITPLFDGIYTEDDHAEPVLNVRSHDVMRLIYLITVNTTTYEHQDLYALMYQISTLNVRLHHWDLDALEYLMRVLDPIGRPHTMYRLKHGIQFLVNKWLMSLNNITTFQEKAKLIRPPCLIPEKMLGSTLPLNTVTHPFPSKTTSKPCHSKKPHDPPEDD